MQNVLNAIWQFGDSINPLSNYAGVIGALISTGILVTTIKTRWDIRRAQEAGQHFDNVKLQVHLLANDPSDGRTTVKLRGLEQATLADVIIGEDLAARTAEAAAKYNRDSRIFRMPTAADQELIMRDFVDWAGRQLPSDALPHVLVLLREPADNVGRSMLRGCLFTLEQLTRFRDDVGLFKTEPGKAHHKNRIIACEEIAQMLVAHDFGSTPAFTQNGFVLAHIVEPGSAAIQRRQA